MARTLITILALIALAGCGSAASQYDGNSGNDNSSSSTDSADTQASEPTPSPEPIPDPDGTFTSSCSYVLGDFTQTESGFRFLADANLDNTGNIGTVNKVTATWQLAGGDNVTEHKKVRIKAGGSKRVGFKRVATQDEIDRHQSLGAGDTCSVDVEIIDTFGEPQSD